MAPSAAESAWNLGKWEKVEEYVAYISEDCVDGNFFRALLAAHKAESGSCPFVARARELLDTELRALVGESYNRAYKPVRLFHPVPKFYLHYTTLHDPKNNNKCR
jgi:FKBP12-rapamycin complex-associated protein